MSGNPAISPYPFFKRGVRDILGLVKLHLSLYIGLTAVTGHVMAGDRLTMASLEIGIWVFILAMGAAMLNNIQDRFFDQRFIRTRTRVLARGDIRPGLAAFMAWGLIFSGLWGLISFYPSPLPFVLGIASLIFYNGVYTPMKKLGSETGRASRWAMIPGTLSGMIPPALGWCGAVKETQDLSGLILFMTGLGLWQLPHYLVLDLKQSSERKTSPWPGFTALWSENESLFQVVIWSSLFSLSMALFLLLGWIQSIVFSLGLLILAISLPLWLSLLFFFRPHNRHLDLGFWSLNLAMLSYMILILMDRI